ncbi:MAG: hypothetical protein KKD01_05465 [Proteobacteria bacterium]|nr:hypothetical protein [Pseudomonadota bacterium]MBU1231514.1 hypothetical protein [Pseudomonadota bacterium]MBU1419721.1 hypothetical protein [Pseudomonadota bacterium]MBU1454158.1 hypothetical protein [Pseudomonadota bacterium]
MKLNAPSCIDEKILSELIDTAQKAVSATGRTTTLGGNYGACVYTMHGLFFKGINLFSPTHSLTLHAEQVALVNAAVHGDPLIQAIAIASDDLSILPIPCGICRQALFENARFSKVDIQLICLRGTDAKSFRLTELYPEPWPDREPQSS